jgi:hypothetical protein
VGAYAGGVLTDTTIHIGGSPYYLHRGYPINWSDLGDKTNIVGLIYITGFTVVPYVSGSYTRYFTMDGSPNPTNCNVMYQFPNGVPPLNITITTTGC